MAGVVGPLRSVHIKRKYSAHSEPLRQCQQRAIRIRPSVIGILLKDDPRLAVIFIDQLQPTVSRLVAQILPRAEPLLNRSRPFNECHRLLKCPPSAK